VLVQPGRLEPPNQLFQIHNAGVVPDRCWLGEVSSQKLANGAAWRNVVLMSNCPDQVCRTGAAPAIHCVQQHGLLAKANTSRIGRSMTICVVICTVMLVPVSGRM
jgi:hypothetical protein